MTISRGSQDTEIFCFWRLFHLQYWQYELKFQVNYYIPVTYKPILVIIDDNYSTEMINFLIEFNRFVICENKPDEMTKVIIKVINHSL